MRIRKQENKKTISCANHNKYTILFSYFLVSLFSYFLISSCSTTSRLQDGEVLYTGLRPTVHVGDSIDSDVQAEVDAALATAPNGALFGSSFHRTIPYALWIYNATPNSWLGRTFGKPPVLMSTVGAPLRAQVAESVMRNNGYFGAAVDYATFPGPPRTTRTDTVPRPRTAKIQYTARYGRRSVIDTVEYVGFPDDAYRRLFGQNRLAQSKKTPSDTSPDSQGHSSLITSHSSLYKVPFTLAALQAERTRVGTLLRNQGYYYYKDSYTTYQADTLQRPGGVQLRMVLADSLPDDALRRWVIGRIGLEVKREYAEPVSDTLTWHYLNLRWGGRRLPLRPRVALGQMHLKPGDIYSERRHRQSLDDLAALGIFSSIDVRFTPELNADSTTHLVPDSVPPMQVGRRRIEQRAGAGVLDMTIAAILDKPYDLSLQANATGKTSDRFGPGLTAAITRRNAFRGGEQLTFSLGANYEFSLAAGDATGSSYDFSAGMALTMPRLWLPKFLQPKRKWYTTPSTSLSLDGKRTRRAGFYTRNAISADLSYTFQPTARSVHRFTPVALTYARLADITDAYSEKIDASVVATMRSADELTPKMQYTYTYNTPRRRRNPLYNKITLTEAGTLTNAVYSIAGKGWNTKDKELLSVPFSQFVKLEVEARKTYVLGTPRATGASSLVLHAYTGYLHAFGNDDTGPFTEQFTIGGANDVRGFALRRIGPGNLHFDDRDLAYIFHNGDLKTVLNIEYRPHLFGSLYGALFLDAGGIWDTRSYDDVQQEGDYTIPEGFDCDTRHFDLAVSTGAGLRYDLDFFVLRIDLGLALHAPYRTERSGFFNAMTSFKDACTLNFAIGYPF